MSTGLVVGVVIHLALGSQRLSIAEVIAGLTDPDAGLSRQIVWDIRLPRTLVAATAGAMLAASGAILQGVLRNSLAAPGLLGVSGGAILAVALVLALGLVRADVGSSLSYAALVGGASSGCVVYLLGRLGGRTDPTRLILVGILVSALTAGGTAMLLLGAGIGVSSVQRWVIGSLGNTVWGEWTVLWPWAAVLLPAAMLCGRMVNVIGLGDETAAGLGLAVERTRLALLALATFLASAAVAVIGAVGFVGLMAPHLARRVVGADARISIPMAAVGGATLLVAADACSKGLISVLPSGTAVVPAGAITAILGAGFFLWLLIREQAA